MARGLIGTAAGSFTRCSSVRNSLTGRSSTPFGWLSDWWLIPGTEDLNGTWHSVHVKQWKLLKLIPFSVPLAAAGEMYKMF